MRSVLCWRALKILLVQYFIEKWTAYPALVLMESGFHLYVHKYPAFWLTCHTVHTAAC